MDTAGASVEAGLAGDTLAILGGSAVPATIEGGAGGIAFEAATSFACAGCSRITCTSTAGRLLSTVTARCCWLPPINFERAAVTNKTRHAAIRNASTRIRVARRACCCGVLTICWRSGKSHVGMLSRALFAAPPSY